MIENILYDVFDFVKTKLESVSPEKLSDNLGDLFLIDADDILNSNAIIARIDGNKSFWFVTWNLSLESFPMKSSIIREAEISTLKGYQYKVIPLTLRVAGNIISNNPLITVRMLEFLFLEQDKSYKLNLTYNFDNREVTIPAIVSIKPEGELSTYKESLLSKVSFDLSIQTVVIRKLSEGKLIQDVESNTEVI